MRADAGRRCIFEVGVFLFGPTEAHFVPFGNFALCAIANHCAFLLNTAFFLAAVRRAGAWKSLLG